jgi:hypothetical protein
MTERNRVRVPVTSAEVASAFEPRSAQEAPSADELLAKMDLSTAVPGTSSHRFRYLLLVPILVLAAIWLAR